VQKEEGKSEQPAHRQFDRKSGTGRGKETKRSGGGRGNWGVQDDERKASEEPIESETKEETPAKTDTTAESTTTTTTDAQPSSSEQKDEFKEEEDNTKTLDEFLGNIKKPSFQLPPPRQVDESVDAKGTAHRKEREEEPLKKEKKEEKKR